MFRHIDPASPGLSVPAHGVELARMFAELGPRQWQAVARAWSERSTADLRREVHKLKGSLVIFGAHKAVEHAGLLEAACALEAAFNMTAAYEGLAAEVAGVTAELERYAAAHAKASA